MIARGRHGDCRIGKPCEFDVIMDVRPTSPFNPFKVQSFSEGKRSTLADFKLECNECPGCKLSDTQPVD